MIGNFNPRVSILRKYRNIQPFRSVLCVVLRGKQATCVHVKIRRSNLPVEAPPCGQCRCGAVGMCCPVIRGAAFCRDNVALRSLQPSVVVPFAVDDPLAGVLDEFVEAAPEEFRLAAFYLDCVYADPYVEFGQAAEILSHGGVGV